LGNVFQAKKIEEEKRQHALAVAFGKEIMSQVSRLHALPTCFTKYAYNVIQKSLHLR
jgi:hypothetical protein